jgi:amino acid adenylation domain-containing protein
VSAPGSLLSLSASRRARLDALLAQEGVLADGGIPRRDPSVPAPLSFAQERLWLLEQIDPGSPAYNAPVALRLGGALDAEALDRALVALAARHEALRTSFAAVEGGAVQQVGPAPRRVLQVEDLAGLGDGARMDVARRRVREEAVRPFDLARGPLLRATLLRLAPDDHVLALNLHHAATDGWSMGVLFRELGVLYAAFARGEAAALPELPLQYADYAVWQRGTLAGERLQAQLEWWRGRLAGAPAVLELPSDRPRPAVRGTGGARVRTRLPREALDRLQALANEQGATLYMVLLAAFQAVLARWSGEDDFVVGTPVAGRSRAELAGLIGFFANTLALRADVSGNPVFRALVGRVREATLGAFDHQELPFERLVAELRPERSLSHSPLFQVMFVLQNAGSAAPSFGEVRASGWEGGFEVAKYDLTLTAAPAETGLGLVLEYATELFDAATAERLAGHVATLLASVAADPDRRVGSVALVSDAERDQALAAWNQTSVDFPPAASVHALVEAQADARPDSIALVDARERVTYGQMERRANRIAQHLLRAGVRPEDRVGVCMERGAAMVAAMLGILKAGGAYVPLDPSVPAERLAYMAADSGMRMVLTQDDLRGRLPIDLPAVCPETDAGVMMESDARPSISIHPDRLVYVIYTSGSTGRPKGVAVPHRGVLNLVRWHNRAYAVTPDDRATQFASPAFDAAAWETWPYLAGGAELHLLDADARETPAAVLDYFSRAGVTLAFLPTPMAEALLDEADRNGCPPLALRALLTGGDALHRGPGAAPFRLVNHYGPTESSVVSTAAEVPADSAGAPPIGGPIDNQTAYVLDGWMNPVPMGVPGELFVGGAGLARGYLGRAAMTAERFVPDPFPASAGARLYRTGDRVRRLADGALEFLGRLDQQVKVRGFRIELGEIEAALGEHPAVRQAAVIVREDAPGEKRLVAYAVLAADAPPVAELRESLRGRLPDYMLPAALVAMDALPLTSNGKLDRRALPAPGAAETAEHDPPRTPNEELLAAVWAEVLGLGRIGRNDDFFAVGGHSLAATRVMGRIHAVLGAELPVRALFESPTLAALAARVDARAASGLPAPPPIEGAAGEGDAPLSFAQQRLWFLDRLAGGGAAYTIPAALRLKGALDVDALRRALAAVAERHPALRTAMPLVDGRPVQRIHPSWEGWAAEDASGIDEADHGRAARERTETEATRPFDLATGPLFRARLIRFASDDHVLVVSLHHAVGDGWSMGVLFREMRALYAAFRAGTEATLPAPAVRYADFAAWQRAWLQGDVLEAQTRFWRERLNGAPSRLELPTDRPRPAVQTFRGDLRSALVPAEVLDRLRAMARREGATLHMALTAAFGVLLSRYSGQDDVVMGTPVSGRTRPETEGVIGLFVNTLALRTDLSGDPTFSALLARVREAALAAYAHQDLPFEQVVEAVGAERALSHAPVFQVLVTLQEADGAPAGLEGVETRGVDLSLRAAKFDLTLGAVPAADGLRLALEYNADLFDPETAERMLAGLRALLDGASADPARRVSALELMDAEERARVTAAATRSFADGPCLHRRFEAVAAARPDAAAVTARDATLTYAELNRRANRIAHRLRALGVGPESRVGVCVDRTSHLPAAILGVLKAGGAYVPVDPAYPAERIDFTLRDAGVAAVLTESGLRDRIPSTGAAVLCVDGPDFAAGDDSNPVGAADPRSLAYVIYTSGSTGRPKGVLVTHANAVRLFTCTDEGFGFGADDVWTLFHSAAFDFSVWELWGALLYGGRLVVVPYADSRDPAAFLRLLARERVTVLNQTPSAFRALVHADDEAAARAGAPELALRFVVFGGEALDPGTLRTWMERRGQDAPRLVNMYGITETTVHVTWRTIGAADAAGTSPIGVPIPDLSIQLLDRVGNPVPPGMPGEIHVGGAGVARGYLGRPGLTAERFVPDPFSAQPGARLYRSGDGARRRADGGLEYMGRLDTQVKVRGFRIELGEIEAVLAAHSAVRACAVGVRGAGEAARLVAWLTAAGAAPDEAELRAHARAALPEYMVPTAFVVMDALPLTSNGKTDRAALPEPARERPAAAADGPRTETETAVAQVWCEVLGVDAVGLDENFFEVGGNSLLVIQVQLRLAEAVGRELSVAELFSNPTVRAVAALLGGARVEEESARAGRDRGELRRAPRAVRPRVGAR